MRGILEAVFLMWALKQHETQILFVSLKYYVNWYPTQFSHNQFQYLHEKLWAYVFCLKLILLRCFPHSEIVEFCLEKVLLTSQQEEQIWTARGG